MELEQLHRLWAGAGARFDGYAKHSLVCSRWACGVTTPGAPFGGLCPLHRGWCVRSHGLGYRRASPYQGNGLGKQMMAYILEALALMEPSASACSRIPVS